MNNLTRRDFLGLGAGALGGVIGGSNVMDFMSSSAWSRLPFMRAQGLPSRIHLAGINWVGQAPEGIRLRWFYPLTVPGSSDFVGFPSRFLVQRSQVQSHSLFPPSATQVDVGSRPRCRLPANWWRQGIQMTSVAPTIFKPAVPSVQGISFVYRGAPSTCEVRDSAHCALAQFAIRDGERLYFEEADIASIAFLSDQPVRISEDRYLDLFANSEVEDWISIAEIAVREPLVNQATGSYDQIISRVYDQPSITEAEWDEIRRFALAADGVRTPADEPPDIILPTWETWFALTTLKWEIATLAGYGFIDGPQRTPRVVGDTLRRPTNNVPTEYRAYRVRADPDPFDIGYSNVVFVCDGRALPLLPPTDVGYADAGVRLVQQVDDFNPNEPSHTVFAGSARLQWRHQDPWAVGVRAEEIVSRSPSKPAQPGSSSTTQLSAGSHDGLDLLGDVRREFNAPFPDSKISAQLASFDGWDRESPLVDIAEVPLQFDHAPAPPPLACAVRDRETKDVWIERLVSSPQATLDCLDMTASYPEWVPDPVVAMREGQLEIARRIRPPTGLDVTITRVVSLRRFEYLVTLREPMGAGQFSRGTLAQGNVQGTIVDVSADRRTLKVMLDGQATLGSSPQGTVSDPGCPPSQQPVTSTPVFTNSAARATEDPSNPALWNPLTSVITINALPAVFNFKDRTVPTGPLEVAVYAARVGFNGFDGVFAHGPYGNAVTALDKQLPPLKPPLFAIQVLGRDYYGRLAVEAKFTRMVDPAATFVMAWAEGMPGMWAEGGDSTKSSFAASGTVGLLGKQRAHRQNQLFEVLEAPEPHFLDMPLTIGIKEVDAIGQESEYSLVELVLPAT